VDVLGRRYGERIARLYGDVLALSDGPIDFERMSAHPEAEARRKMLVLAEHTFDGHRHLVYVDPDDVSEANLAHELAHALLTARGYPVVSQSERPYRSSVAYLNTMVSDRVLHIPIKRELAERGFDLAATLQPHVASHLEMSRHSAPTGGPPLLTREVEEALWFVEATYGYPDHLNDIEPLIQTNVPGGAELGAALVDVVEQLGVRSPELARQVIVAFFEAIDEHANARGIALNSREQALITPIWLTEPEARGPAPTVLAVRNRSGQDAQGGFVRSLIMTRANRGPAAEFIFPEATPEQVERTWADLFGRMSAEELLRHARVPYAVSGRDLPRAIWYPPAV
jgi:hypothetical protein